MPFDSATWHVMGAEVEKQEQAQPAEATWKVGAIFSPIPPIPITWRAWGFYLGQLLSISDQLLPTSGATVLKQCMPFFSSAAFFVRFPKTRSLLSGKLKREEYC